jgi:hypothetical protein
VTFRKYADKKFSSERRRLIALAIEIVDNYRNQGYALTLRQLYYQMVSRDLFPESWQDPATGSTNNERSYKKLGDVISDARMAGLISWQSIEDRTREVNGNTHWRSPAGILRACAEQFQFDKWEDQDNRVEIFVEKDALEGVVARAARELDVKYFSCRGYASVTSLWDAGQRLKNYVLRGQKAYVLHLGDHDPSGIDMTRDIIDRVRLFMDDQGDQLEVVRIALNRDQVDQYNPPPNPAKVTDSRFAGYVATHGNQCWELDALDPTVIDSLIRQHVLSYRNRRRYNAQVAREEAAKAELATLSQHWTDPRLRTLLNDLNQE